VAKGPGQSSTEGTTNGKLQLLVGTSSGSPKDPEVATSPHAQKDVRDFDHELESPSLDSPWKPGKADTSANHMEVARSARSQSSCSDPSVNAEEIAAEKERLQQVVKAFIPKIVAGINCILLGRSKEYTAAKVSLDSKLRTMKVVSGPGNESYSMFLTEVDDFFNYDEACVIFEAELQGLYERDRSRAIVVAHQQSDKGRAFCLLEADGAARATFITSMKILRLLRKWSV